MAHFRGYRKEISYLISPDRKKSVRLWSYLRTPAFFRGSRQYGRNFKFRVKK